MLDTRLRLVTSRRCTAATMNQASGHGRSHKPPASVERPPSRQPEGNVATRYLLFCSFGDAFINQPGGPLSLPVAQHVSSLVAAGDTPPVTDSAPLRFPLFRASPLFPSFRPSVNSIDPAATARIVCTHAVAKRDADIPILSLSIGFSLFFFFDNFKCGSHQSERKGGVSSLSRRNVESRELVFRTRC